MATRSRARHFHATAKALTNAAATRGSVDDSLLLTADVSNVDISSIIAGGMPSDHDGRGADMTDTLVNAAQPMVLEHAPSEVHPELLVRLHDELRWAESKLMQASERLAEAQEMRRKDLVALAIMRRELLGSFRAERSWLTNATKWMHDVRPALVDRERELDELVENGVLTEQVIEELAAVRSERKLFELALQQNAAQLARIDDNEATSEYNVASEAYDREPDGASMREVARLRAQSTRMRREANRMKTETSELLESLGFVRGMGEITAANAFLVSEYEGEHRAAERMARVRAAQVELELKQLPEPESAWKAGLKHPVHFMRARRTTR